MRGLDDETCGLRGEGEVRKRVLIERKRTAHDAWYDIRRVAESVWGDQPL
jgi:hypothetical protein